MKQQIAGKENFRTLEDNAKNTNATEEILEDIEGIEQYHTKTRTWERNFELKWKLYLTNWLENCSCWDVPDYNYILFLRYTLGPYSDTRTFYHN